MAETLQAQRRRLRLGLASDLGEFRAALDRRDWARASALPGGPFLDGVQFTPYPALAEWLNIERESLRRAWRKALVEAAAQGATIDAELSRYVAAYPTDAELVAHQATRLSAAGRALDAQEAIAAFKRAAADEMTAEELDEQLLRLEHAAAAATPDVRAADSLALVGRQAELAQLDVWLQERRWVTVVGLPGAGKSAVLRQWLTRRAASGAQGRWVRVELNDRSTAWSVAEAVHAALAPPAAPRHAASRPVALLAPLQGLVVIDGIDPGHGDDQIVALLRQIGSDCPGLRVLAASRAPLGVEDERVLRLQGLSVEPAAPGARSDAARLLMQEVQRVRPNHRWAESGDELENIARLCAGLPLALKLVASWSRWLEPKVLAGEFKRSLRDAASSFDHSMHAWLAPSWARLAPAPQVALSALSLFPGSFDIRDAAAVSASALDEIEALVAQCLVEVVSEAPPRLRMHALVREFAMARLHESPARRREAVSRYLAVVDARLGPRPTEGGHPIFKLTAVKANIDDVLAAWPLSLEIGALAHMSPLAAALLVWHEAMGEYRVGAQRLAAALDALDETVAGEAAVLAHIQVGRATLLYRAGDHDAAEGLAQQAQRLAQATGQQRIVRRSMNVLGLSRWMMLRLDEAKLAFEQGLASAAEDGERRGESVFSANLALVEASRGEYAAAEASYRRAIELDRTLEDWPGTCSCLNNLANLLRDQGRLDECEALALECLRLSHEHALDAQRPFALIGLALLHHAKGRPDSAEQYLGLLDACAEDQIEGAVHAGASQLRAKIALDRGDGDQALQHVARAVAVCIENDDAANLAESLALYGQWLDRQEGRHDEALRLWTLLLHASSTHATLKDELRARLGALAQDAPASPATRSDLALAAEQALATARRHAGGNPARRLP